MHVYLIFDNYKSGVLFRRCLRFFQQVDLVPILQNLLGMLWVDIGSWISAEIEIILSEEALQVYCRFCLVLLSHNSMGNTLPTTKNLGP